MDPLIFIYLPKHFQELPLPHVTREQGPGQIVIDVGVSFDDQGKMHGDVNFAQVEPVVKAITPVPGGVGAVTSAVLSAHTVESALRANGLTG